MTPNKTRIGALVAIVAAVGVGSYLMTDCSKPVNSSGNYSQQVPLDISDNESTGDSIKTVFGTGSEYDNGLDDGVQINDDPGYDSGLETLEEETQIPSESLFVYDKEFREQSMYCKEGSWTTTDLCDLMLDYFAEARYACEEFGDPDEATDIVMGGMREYIDVIDLLPPEDWNCTRTPGQMSQYGFSITKANIFSDY
ncbi:hypothetical protein HOC01_03710 [archaeon]|jgi:hypothetical protein|nr:hypothetical protein [archaeon]MBT6698482.1 hypothetical protein [archaeon]